MTEVATIAVEVAFALPQKQMIIPLRVEPGTTALEAAQRSGIVEHFKELSLDDAKLGVFGKAVTHTTVLREGDRVEIYRPLIADPKEVRKARAAQAKERRALEKEEKKQEKKEEQGEQGEMEKKKG